MQLTKKSTCPTKFFSCPKKINNHLFVPFNNIPYPYCQLASSPSMNRIVEWHLDGKLAN
jgi:hypothetical protein